MEFEYNLSDLGSLDSHELRRIMATYPDDHPFVKVLSELL